MVILWEENMWDMCNSMGRKNVITVLTVVFVPILFLCGVVVAAEIICMFLSKYNAAGNFWALFWALFLGLIFYAQFVLNCP